MRKIESLYFASVSLESSNTNATGIVIKQVAVCADSYAEAEKKIIDAIKHSYMYSSCDILSIKRQQDLIFLK